MIEEGLLDAAAAPAARPTAAFAIHIATRYPTGEIHLRPGAADGRDRRDPDHRPRPRRPRLGAALALDPIAVAAEIVLALQAMVTRRIDVFDPAVVTIAQITAGTTNNIIPETALLLGTIRTVSEETRAAVRAGVRRVAEGIAAAHGATAELEIEPGYPVTINDDEFAAFVLESAAIARRRRARSSRLQGADHGRRGLLLRPPAGARARWRSSARGPPAQDPDDRAAEPLEPRRLRRGGDGRSASPSTPRSRSGTSPAAERGASPRSPLRSCAGSRSAGEIAKLSWTSTMKAIAGSVPTTTPIPIPTAYRIWATTIRRRIARPTSGPTSLAEQARPLGIDPDREEAPARRGRCQPVEAEGRAGRWTYSASSEVVNGNRATRARNRSASQARSRLPRSK